MATKHVPAKTPPPSAARRPTGKPDQPRPNAFVTVWAIFAGLFSRIQLPERFRRELSAVGLILLAAISSWALTPSGQDGAISAWWGRTIAAALGASAFLLPTFAAMLAVRALRLKDGAIIMGRHYAGAALFMCGVVGLLDCVGGGCQSFTLLLLLRLLLSRLLLN